MAGVRNWLNFIGLGQYAEAFEQNAVEFDQLATLTNNELLALGVEALGHRKRIRDNARLLSKPGTIAADRVADTLSFPPVMAGDAECRQMTIMFCDLVGSTSLSARLGLEAYREVLSEYQRATSQAIAPFDGYVSRYLGDGMLVYFGHPWAHEDDAERAVRAGLLVVDNVSRIRPSSGEPLAVRIGISTGIVVAGNIVGDGASEEWVALGETPNLAARLQAMAAPNTVMLSDSTRRLVQGRFVLETLGEHRFKGIDRPVPVYRAVAVRNEATRFEAAHTGGLTPLIGRVAELAMLGDRWAQACAGAGQAVLVQGEPGIGKSRLINELRETVRAEAGVVQRYQCSPYYTDTAFHAVIDFLERAARFAPDDDAQTKLDKLEALIDAQPSGDGTAIVLLASLLGLPVDRYPSLQMTPKMQRAETIRTLIARLTALSVTGPVLILFEDAHWIDPSTQELMDVILEHVRALPVLVLITHRPDFQPPWSLKEHVSTLSLGRLEREDVEAMAARLAGSLTLPPRVLDYVSERSDGVPLFVEQLMKDLLVEGVQQHEVGRSMHGNSSPGQSIPAALHDALTARLDRMGSAKVVAQRAAALGREFDFDLLLETAGLDAESLHRELGRLQKAGLIQQRDLGARPAFMFKHALLRDAAYRSLLSGERQRFHGRIAAVIERRVDDGGEAPPELLAFHFREAGRYGKAITYSLAAAERAIGRSAYSEAISLLGQGLDMVDGLADDAERNQQELLLQTRLANTLMATRGFGAPEVERAFARARELCDLVGDTPWLFPVLRGLAAYYSVKPDYAAALGLGELCLGLAERQQQSQPMLGARLELGGALFSTGRFREALMQLEEGCKLYAADEHRPLAATYGYDVGVACMCRAAYVKWYLGYPDQALAQVQQALAIAERGDDLHTRLYALMFAAVIRQLRGEVPRVRELSEHSLALATVENFPLWWSAATLLRGWVMSCEGHAREGLEQLNLGLSDWRATGAEMSLPYFLSLRADALRRCGESASGLEDIEEALGLADKNGEVNHKSELLRMHGELLLTQSPEGPPEIVAAARGRLTEALAVAHEQGARTLELRAALSLAQLLEREGQGQSARRMVGEVHDWFTEGVELADMAAARSLLDSLH